MNVEVGKISAHHKHGNHFEVKVSLKYGTRSVHISSINEDLYKSIDEAKDKKPEKPTLLDPGTYNGLKFRSIGPAVTSGRISDFAVNPNNQAEYYLTDCPLVLKRDGKVVAAANVFEVSEAMGVNTRVQLADVTRAIQQATMSRLMLSGVTVNTNMRLR